MHPSTPRRFRPPRSACSQASAFSQALIAALWEIASGLRKNCTDGDLKGWPGPFAEEQDLQTWQVAQKPDAQLPRTTGKFTHRISFVPSSHNLTSHGMRVARLQPSLPHASDQGHAYILRQAVSVLRSPLRNGKQHGFPNTNFEFGPAIKQKHRKNT